MHAPFIHLHGSISNKCCASGILVYQTLLAIFHFFMRGFDLPWRGWHMHSLSRFEDTAAGVSLKSGAYIRRLDSLVCCPIISWEWSPVPCSVTCSVPPLLSTLSGFSFSLSISFYFLPSQPKTPTLRVPSSCRRHTCRPRIHRKYFGGESIPSES